MGQETFATLYRRERSRAGKSMGEVARHLGISVTYLSDVERGKRPALSTERIRKSAELLGTDETVVSMLIGAAQAQKESIQLPVPDSDRGREVGVALQRRWATFGDDTFDELMQIIEGKQGK